MKMGDGGVGLGMGLLLRFSGLEDVDGGFFRKKCEKFVYLKRKV